LVQQWSILIEEYKNAYENIISIMGIGQIGAIVLLHLFLKHPDANPRQIVSLTGLNPVYKQTTQVQIAVMRKLIITAHSLYKNNRRYDAEFNT